MIYVTTDVETRSLTACSASPTRLCWAPVIALRVVCACTGVKRAPCAGLSLPPSRVVLAAQPAAAVEEKPGQGFAFHYKMMNRDEDKLGEGQFATVRKAIQKKTNKVVAVKCILVSKLTKEDEEALKIEIEVMKTVLCRGLSRVCGWLVRGTWTVGGAGVSRGGADWERQMSWGVCPPWDVTSPLLLRVVLDGSCVTPTSSRLSTTLRTPSTASWSWS